MSKPELLEKKPVSLTEMKKELETAQKRDGELGFRGNKTLEYVQQFVRLTRKAHDELKTKLGELKVPRLKAEHITKIVDILPSSVAELDVILQGYTITITKENKSKIVNQVKEFLPKKAKEKDE